MALPAGKTFPYVPSMVLMYWPVELELASAAIVWDFVDVCATRWAMPVATRGDRRGGSGRACR
jgi:hypothetical protein